jgi:hypothetical protein
VLLFMTLAGCNNAYFTQCLRRPFKPPLAPKKLDDGQSGLGWNRHST